MIELKRYLEDLEARISPAAENALAEQWRAFCALGCQDEFFSPQRLPAPPHISWPNVPLNAALDDMEAMLYTQLKGASDELEKGSGLMLSVRANYGTGIIPTMFGAELLYLNDDAGMLPGARPLPGGVDALRAIVDAHRIDYQRGLSPRVFEFGARWNDLVRDYPNIAKHVHVYNPDLQGPFALIDMLAGSGLYLALYDEPELVHAALDFMTELYIDYTRRWQALCPPYDEAHSIEWGLMHRGRTMLRNDAIVNLSEAMYREFAQPYDARIFKALGGGMHFCGRGDHYIAAACELTGLSCINMSQPELNDMERIYAATIDNDILIIGMPPAEIMRAGRAGRHLHGRVQSGASLAAYLSGNCIKQ